MVVTGKNQVLGEKPVGVLLCPPRDLHALAWDRTRVCVLTGRQIIACAMARPCAFFKVCLKFQSVPRSKHTVSVIQTSQLMLYREIIAVCSQIHTKHINKLCGQNVELLNVKLAVHIVTTRGTYSDHFSSSDYTPVHEDKQADSLSSDGADRSE